MIENIKKEADQRMQKAVEAFRHELTKLRTGRAHPSLLDHVKVESYGSVMPLSQVASVVASDARLLTITPWDKNMVTPIEKAIMQADLGLNPVSTGQVIRVPLPPLTEERRRDLAKIVRTEVENARVGVRNVRRDANQQLKDLLKAKSITEDDLHRTEENVQKMTDKFVSELDKIAAAKEAELMEV